MECVQSYITKLECLNGDCVQYSMKHCIPKNKYEGTQRLEELFMPFAPFTVTEQFPMSYMDIGEYHDDLDVSKKTEMSDEEEEEEDVDEVQQDVCSEKMIDNLLNSLEVKKVKNKSTSKGTTKKEKTKKTKKQQKNNSKKK